MSESLLEVGILDLIDVLVVAALVWLTLRYLRRTRARPALLGLTMLGGVYLVARWLSLELTAALFQAFFAVLVLVMVVVFQDDLRRLFEQLGAWGSRRNHERRASDALDVLARAVARLAANRTGALIVLARGEPLDRHLEGGIPLGGRLSEPLLLSLFDVHSPGHDGAVVLHGTTVERFATHLPLSADHEQLGAVGTRHAAALGLAERCDAVCVVVSEERGTVSVARDGKLTELARPEDLFAALADLRETEPARAPWRDPGAWREAGLAAAIALALWLVFVPGSREIEVKLLAPVVVERLPKEYQLEGVVPEEVEVTLSGRRRDLLLARGNVEAKIDALLVKLGRRSFELTADDVTRPAGVEVVRITPARVRLNVGEGAPAEAGGAGEPAEAPAPNGGS